MKKKVEKISSNKEVLKVKKFFRDVCLPEYAISSDVGFDIRANENVSLNPFDQKTVRTGIAIQIPEGHVGLIRDRVGITTKMGVHTAAGTFDPAYRGEISIVLINFGEEAVQIEKGMRIAQMIIIPVKKVKIQEVSKLDITDRYDKGFGSTGIKSVIRDLSRISGSGE
jgi:dUTP pyrophosphatase